MLQKEIYPALFIIIGAVLFLVFSVFFYLLFNQLHRRRLQYQKELLNQQLSYETAVLRAQINTQEEILTKVSEEIHDNIGQMLSLAKLNLNTLPQAQQSEKTALTAELVAKSISDLRDLSKSMLGEKVKSVGLAQAILHEVQIINKSTSIKATLHCSLTDISINEDQTLVLFRIVQELLNNALKHAEANSITITITENAEKIILTVTDDGKGFDVNSLTTKDVGIGLLNMQKRCKNIGAQLVLDSTQKKGTNITIFVQPTTNNLHD